MSKHILRVAEEIHNLQKQLGTLEDTLNLVDQDANNEATTVARLVYEIKEEAESLKQKLADIRAEKVVNTKQPLYNLQHELLVELESRQLLMQKLNETSAQQRERRAKSL